MPFQKAMPAIMLTKTPSGTAEWCMIVLSHSESCCLLGRSPYTAPRKAKERRRPFTCRSRHSHSLLLHSKQLQCRAS